MLNKISLEEAVGHTLIAFAHAYDEPRLLLKFDNGFMCLSRVDFPCDNARICAGDFILSYWLEEPDDKIVLDLGIVTPEEVEEARWREAEGERLRAESARREFLARQQAPAGLRIIFSGL